MRIRLPSLCVVFLALAALHAYGSTPVPAPVVNLDGLGMGTAHLDGPWQFHTGDNPQWAEPGIDDAAGQNGWETIQPDRPWGAQSHYAYAGYAWYRLHLHITPSSGFKSEFQLVLPRLSDACEVYWNGTLVGRYGSMPPHPSWPVFDAPAVFTLRGAPEGVLAIRFWKGALGSSASGEVGGLMETPVIGDKSSVAAYLGAWNYDLLRGTMYFNVLNLLYLAVGIAGLLLWLRAPARNPAAVVLDIHHQPGVLDIPLYDGSAALEPVRSVPAATAMGTAQRGALVLLIEMLHLRTRPRLVRWAKILAAVSLSTSFLDGLLTYIPSGLFSAHTGAWIDGILTAIIEPCDLYLLVLVAFGFRQKLDSVRWVLAVSASLSQLINVIIATAQQGQRFTHWTLAQRLLAPLFHIGPVYFNAQSLLDLLVFFSIVYAVTRLVRDQQVRKALLEQELHSAQELQQVLIPEKPPMMPGYTIASAYHPALDVGGDFFQINCLPRNFLHAAAIQFTHPLKRRAAFLCRAAAAGVGIFPRAGSWAIAGPSKVQRQLHRGPLGGVLQQQI